MSNPTFEQAFTFSLQELLDAAIAADRKPKEPRDYLYASEVGGSYFDAWHGMQNTPRTDPPTKEALRRMLMGKKIEDVCLGLVAEKYGGLREDVFEFGGEYGVPIHGRGDYLPTDPVVPVEMKSTHSRSWWHRVKGEEGFMPYQHHALQLVTSLIHKDLDYGKIIYVSREDFTIAESPQHPHLFIERLEWEERWMHWMTTMEGIWTRQEEPEPEPRLHYNEDKGAVEANWKLVWSDWLKLALRKQGLDDAIFTAEEIQKESKRVANRAKNMGKDEAEAFVEEVNLKKTPWYAKEA